MPYSPQEEGNATLVAITITTPMAATATPEAATVGVTALPTATSNPPATPLEIGRSAGGRPLLAWQLGDGPASVILIGGLHGGYEWNTILLVEELLAYFRANPAALPGNLTLHLVPNANPDGLIAVTGPSGTITPSHLSTDTTPGRFNGRGVDLNRNWDCNWSPQALWRDRSVPPGDAPFSEPETQALRDYLLALRPSVVIFYHSAANGVYVSGCPDPHPRSYELADLYGAAAGYAVYPLFDHYTITGDAGDWLTTQGVASFSVELTNHEALDWEQNLAAITELLRVVARSVPATNDYQRVPFE